MLSAFDSHPLLQLVNSVVQRDDKRAMNIKMKGNRKAERINSSGS